MILSKTLVASAGLMLLVGTSPAYAQHRGGDGHGHGGGSNGGNGGARSGTPRSFNGARASVAPHVSAPSRSVGIAPRAYGHAAPRVYAGAAHSHVYAGAAHSNVAYGHGHGYPVYGHAHGYPVYGHGHYHFAQPYYAFRPYVSLGFGLWAGYPVAYPYAYGYYYPPAYPAYSAYSAPYPAAGYPYPATSAYPAAAYPPPAYPAPSGSIGVEQGQAQANTGGVSFDISPSTAQVFVDGSFVGTAGEFGPSAQPLGLTAGRHRIEVREPAYQTITFNADIVAGQVVPYRGSMQR